MGWWSFIVIWTLIGVWGAMVSIYRARHITTYETDRNLLAWGARSFRYRKRSARQIGRASMIEAAFCAALLVGGDAAMIVTRLSS